MHWQNSSPAAITYMYRLTCMDTFIMDGISLHEIPRKQGVRIVVM